MVQPSDIRQARVAAPVGLSVQAGKSLEWLGRQPVTAVERQVGQFARRHGGNGRMRQRIAPPLLAFGRAVRRLEQHLPESFND
ncbi:hypothetical protein ACSBOB_24890 [Mesorhizobium sp. ASY16-5R]|uniref:hypothetical protein n=1 Tax=Mesorhizobium sp. ASY16-5R TaxID=3445772 RepID=UPI003F9FC91A